MWRLAFILCLLPSSMVFAGETRGQMQVGLTITGTVKASAVSPAAVAARHTQASVPLPRRRPAAIGPGDTAPSGVGGTLR
jgi:hypothetical protein